MSLWWCDYCKALVGGQLPGRCGKCNSVTSYATLGPPIPPAHIEAARRVDALLKPVPVNEIEKLPDPDYGL